MAIFGSAFWGPGDAQQDAEGFFPAQGQWNEQQYRDMLARMAQYGYNADEWQNWGVDYFQNLATHGIGTPDDVRNYGDWIMPQPGRRDLIDARGNRLAGVGTDLGETFGGVNQRYGQLGQGIGQNYDIIQGDINDAFGRSGALNEAVGADIRGNIGDTYGGARKNVFDTMTGLRRGSFDTFDAEREGAAGLYGDLSGRSEDLYGDLSGRSTDRFGNLQGRSTGRYGELQGRSGQQIAGLQGRSTDRFGNLQQRSGEGFGELAGRAGDVYGGLRTDADTTMAGLRTGNEGAYDEATRALDVLSPTGDARAATAARAFAPQVASTRGRLRAAGIDANSPEAASVLGRVEAQRSRAMDDAYSDAAREFVDRKTALTLGQEGVNRDLGLTGLQTRLGLGQTEEEIGRGLGLGALENYQQLGLGELENNQGLSMADLANYLGLSERELMNYQNLGLGELENNQGLQERGLQNYQGLQTEGGAIGRQLALDRLMNDQGLTERQLGMDTDLSLQGGSEMRNELRRNLGMSTDLEMDRLAQTTGNRDRAFDRAWNWTEGQNALDREGWNARAGLAREQNAEDQWAYNFDTLQPWMMGNDWLTQQERIRSGAAGPVLNAGNTAANQAIAQGQLARGFGSDAGQNYGQTIAIESPNAGWGAKMIAAAASAGLGAAGGAGFIPPGMASAGQGIIGGSPVGGGQRPNYGAGGGYYGQTYGGGGGYSAPYQPPAYGSGASPQNPMIFGWQPQAGPAPTAYWGDPGQYNVDYNLQPPSNYRIPRRQQNPIPR